MTRAAHVISILLRLPYSLKQKISSLARVPVSSAVGPADRKDPAQQPSIEDLSYVGELGGHGYPGRD